MVDGDGELNENGGIKANECLPNESKTGSITNDYGNKIGVQCCDQSGVGRRDSVDGLDCVGQQNGATYDEAWTACNDVGMRLCTVQEVEAKVGQGHGCFFDAYHVWTSDPCGTGLFPCFPSFSIPGMEEYA